MVLKVELDSVWYELDLFPDEKVEVDYKIFPLVNTGDTGVSYTNSFEIPKTDFNMSLIETLLVGDESTTMPCSLRSSYECVDEEIIALLGDYYEGDYDDSYYKDGSMIRKGIEFYGTLYVDKSSSNTTNASYEVMVVDGLKAKLELLDKPLSDLFATDGTDSFTYNTSVDTPTIPVLNTTGKFFFSQANFNGSPYENTIDGIPLYTARMLNTDVFQLYWTWKYFDLLKFFMDDIGLDYKFDTDTNVTAEATLGNLYFALPAPLITTSERALQFTLAADDQIERVVDYGDQLVLGDKESTGKMDYFVATVDTRYQVNWSINTDTAPVNYQHYYQQIGACTSTAKVNVPHTGNVYLTLDIYTYSGDDTDLKFFHSVDISSTPLSLGDNYLNGTGDYEVEFEAATKYVFRLGLRFANYYFEDGWYIPVPDGMGGYDCEYEALADRTWNGMLANMVANSMPVTTVDYDNLSSPHHLESVYNRSPLVREGFLETVSPKLSLNRINVTPKSILEDIIKRYNIGIWYDSDGEFNIGRYQDRYSGILDLRGLLVDEKNIESFSQDLTRKFSFKNATTKAVKYKLEKFDLLEDDVSYSLGDVLETVVNESGSEDLAISLKSSNWYKEMYGDPVENPYTFLDEVNSIAYWGVGENEQLSYKDLKPCHGYLETTARASDIRLSYVISKDEIVSEADYETGDEDKYRVVCETYANRTVTAGTAIVNMFFMRSVTDTDTLLLGNEDGEFNTTPIESSIIPNFEILFDITSGSLKKYKEVEVPLNTCQILQVLQGFKVRFDNTEDLYLPLDMEGVQFDKRYSIVTLKLLKE